MPKLHARHSALTVCFNGHETTAAPSAQSRLALSVLATGPTIIETSRLNTA